MIENTPESAPRLTGERGASELLDCTAPLLVDRREAARLLGVSPGTIDNMRNREELPSIKIGARRLFAVADLEALVAARREGGAA